MRLMTSACAASLTSCPFTLRIWSLAKSFSWEGPSVRVNAEPGINKEFVNIWFFSKKLMQLQTLIPRVHFSLLPLKTFCTKDSKKLSSGQHYTCTFRTSFEQEKYWASKETHVFTVTAKVSVYELQCTYLQAGVADFKAMTVTQKPWSTVKIQNPNCVILTWYDRTYHNGFFATSNKSKP